VRPGQLFATFHSPEVLTNALTGDRRDRDMDTPEYKVIAVRVEADVADPSRPRTEARP
jgi:formate dehydrogenase major subunit